MTQPKFKINWVKVGFLIFEIVLFTAIGIINYHWGRKDGINEVEKQAIETKHGEYEIQPDKTITFKWKK